MRLAYTDHSLKSLERSLSCLASEYGTDKALEVGDEHLAIGAKLMTYN